MNTRSISRIKVLAGLALCLPLMSGCQLIRDAEDCAEPQRYQSATEGRLLEAPEGLAVPDQRPDRRIPDARAEAGASVGRCLEAPPVVLSNQSQLAIAERRDKKAPKAPERKQAPPWPELTESSWVSIDPLEGVDLATPLFKGLPAWQIHDALQGWAEAWSRQESDPYFAFYAGSFQPEGDLTWTEWRNDRMRQLIGPTGVDVSVYGTEAQAMSPDRVIVRFTQRYRSDAGAAVNRKQMILVREGDVWSIQRERETG